MTATATASPALEPRRSWLLRLTAWPIVIAAVSAGVLLIGLSYRFSATGASPGVYYGTFWLGVLLGMLPLAGRIAVGSRIRAVALLGVFSFVPKFLRNPDGPDYHDEYAHWREAVDVLASGHLLRPNTLIPIVQYYPGTSGLTATVQRLTGLSVWHSGELVIFVFHLLALFAVFVLAETHLGSPTAGALAALGYSLNPSEMYFDTQYAYESIAIALFLWVLALTSLAARAHGRLRISYTVTALLCAGACVVTHHLSTLFLISLLFVIALAGTVRRSSGGRIWWLVWAGTTAMAAAWVLAVARPTLTYLSPYLGGSVHELSSMTGRPGGGRRVLAASAEPLWEHVLTALTPLVIGLICVWALLILRREHRRWRTDTLTLMAFGLLYFVALPFLLAPLGAEGARRSWAFSFAGLSLIGAFVVTRVMTRTRWYSSTPALLVTLTVLLIGGVGAGLNDPYRFPEPFHWGTESDSGSAEVKTVAEQLAAETGPVRVVTDRYTALDLAAYGGFQISAPSAGFPAWELTQSPGDPDPTLVSELVGSHYDYLVVDTRMATQPPFNGNNYGSTDPLQDQATPMAQLTRLDQVPWAARILATPHLRVYRLNLTLLGTTTTGGS